MISALKLLLQAMTYAGFAAFLGYLSASPAYDYEPADMASVKLSLSHAANRVKPCARLTPQEIAELAPNMRVQQRCERERLPLSVQLVVDGDIVIDLQASPSGVWNDGAASVYERFNLPPGKHELTARLRDSDRADGWDYTHSETVILRPGRYFTVTFHPETGGFRFR